MALFSVYKGFSNNSAKDLNATFCEMFPDSMVVSQFQLGPDKLKYFTNWGGCALHSTVTSERTR